MTYEKALHDFWNSFGIPAYVSSSVPVDVVFPYIVYERVYPAPNDVASGAVNVYYYSESEVDSNAKAREIRQSLNVQIQHQDGSTWLVLGSPAQLNLVNADNNNIKQKQINVTYYFNAKEI